ncbi:MAG: hypothetical protein O3A78_02770 [Nitrospinae bacterium]|nr:hypothetical protein [Nitrospinota bacterium]MDA1108730.1 hypothetical protein [Nitrospinota bacterium]
MTHSLSFFMQFTFSLNFNRSTILFSGLLGLILMVAFFSIPQIFADSLDSERAKDWIRRHLKTNIALRHMQEMKAAGLKSPDKNMAERLNAELEQFERTQFISVEVKHFLFVPTLITSSRMFVVKTVLRPENKKEETLYFSMSARNNLFDFFWVAEQSQWMWYFSI